MGKTTKVVREKLMSGKQTGRGENGEVMRAIFIEHALWPQHVSGTSYVLSLTTEK